ncbi:hypothetical protein D3OALGA1CA_969 [Olavius algarvensis associated proteobacterium Delta 3]|nr:hypothetical protein D3OALGA1CA_969 [Olavius algarvensis associated proteobacterium Delta 3]CAB5129969.1 hypothetical protein D3OALGB2SA_3555 [Olavius algarvensis associated proteobacterium Delta 3]
MYSHNSPIGPNKLIYRTLPARLSKDGAVIIRAAPGFLGGVAHRNDRFGIRQLADNVFRPPLFGNDKQK